MNYLPDSSSLVNLPDFSAFGYQANEELGYNRYRGQATYKATDLNTDQSVVIKHIEFPKRVDDFKVWEQGFNNELNALQSLNHPNIPHVLANFQMVDKSRCIVMECMPGCSLAVRRSFKPDQIKVIAVSLLETLVYLQEERVPFVLHRDIKPANVIVDETSNPVRVSLVDFGIARIGSKELGMTSMVQGTTGYIAPEQQRKRILTKAADLYGLGATLICLIAGIEQNEIDNLTDNQNQINFKRHASDFSPRFIEWLDEMVAPDPKERFPDAKTALEALKPLYVKRLPKCKLNTTDLQLRATQLGEKVGGKITVTNSVPETVLQGTWEVQYHPQKDTTDWIRVEPTSFKGNEETFRITADTSKLIAGKKFKRTLILHTPNAEELEQSIEIQVGTADLPIPRKPVPYKWIAAQFITVGISSAGIAVALISSLTGAICLTWNDFSLCGLQGMVWVGLWAGVGILVGTKVRSRSLSAGVAVGGFFIMFSVLGLAGPFWGHAGLIAMYGVVLGAAFETGFRNKVFTVFFGLLILFMITELGSRVAIGLVILVIGPLIGCGALLTTSALFRDFNEKQYSLFTNIYILLITSLLGIGCSCLLWDWSLSSILTPPVSSNTGEIDSIKFIVSLMSQWLRIPTIASGILLTLFLILPPLQRYLKVMKYRKQEKHLIRP